MKMMDYLFNVPKAIIMTQNEYLLKHFKDGKRITSRQAYVQHGITQLGRCVDDLEKEGHTIHRDWIEVPTRHGEGTTKVKEYYMVEQGQQAMFAEPTKSRAYSL